ncbi:MAG: aminotransferase class I/II-fold pyridoxal phosphate-dependent enzyme [Thermodesulfobacteriota bacterium]
MQIARRLDHLQGVLVMEMNMRLARLKQEGKDIINLGVGDPDFPPPAQLIKVLEEAVRHPDYHHYPSFYPHQPLREAIAQWYKRRFGVDVDPLKEVLPLLGSTDALFLIHLCLLDAGDLALVPDPGYPSYEAGVKVAGGQVEKIPLLKENNFLADLDQIPAAIAQRAKMIWINYPNNPTGATAPPEFYERLIAWAKGNDVFVVADNAYSEIYFDGQHPHSFLEFPGAKEVGVELHSLSKTYNCCGWRSGMLVGNKDIISAMSRIKAHSDRGMFYPMQLVSIAALQSSDEFRAERNRIFQERRDIFLAGLKEIGLEAYPPQATFYLWARVPPKYTSLEFCFQALEGAHVWMIPGSLYGQYGEGYMRIALTHSREKLKEAIWRLKNFLGK